MSGKISLFSITNDFTMPIQFKDSDILNAFQTKLKSTHLEFYKLSKNKFIILHSQCNVKYEIDGFKEKNQDKILPEIADIVNNLFEGSNKGQ
jgi:myosin heavy subunit